MLQCVPITLEPLGLSQYKCSLTFIAGQLSHAIDHLMISDCVTHTKMAVLNSTNTSPGALERCDGFSPQQDGLIAVLYTS